jgi:endonuclease YncB( thermonuclease family)
MKSRPQLRRLIRALSALSLLLLAAAPAGSFRARVVKMDDGDSFVVVHDNIRVKVRLYGVDAPEYGQPHSVVARQFASGLIFQKTVTVIPRDYDRYNRTVAEVILPDGRSLNELMVAGGHAWWYRQFAPDNARLQALEATARKEKRGLWAAPDPIPPWEWRRNREELLNDPAAGWCASKTSKIYHHCSCEIVSTIEPKNLIRFKTEAEAKAGGRTRCKPEQK